MRRRCPICDGDRTWFGTFENLGGGERKPYSLVIWHHKHPSPWIPGFTLEQYLKEFIEVIVSEHIVNDQAQGTSYAIMDCRTRIALAGYISSSGEVAESAEAVQVDDTVQGRRDAGGGGGSSRSPDATP